MDYKKTNANDTTITRDFTDLEKDTGNIYKSLVITGKRSKQIQKEIKEELNQNYKNSPHIRIIWKKFLKIVNKLKFLNFMNVYLNLP